MKEDSTAVVLFSGGADSSLAAILALEKHGNIILLTFESGYELFIGRSCIMADRLKDRYAYKSVTHKIIDNRDIFKLVIRNNLSYMRYLKSPGLLCSAERAAVYIRTTAFCLENRFKHVYDGSNCSQGQVAIPQMPDFLLIIKNFFQQYGILYHTPIYEYKDLSEELLFEQSLIKKSELYQKGRLFFKDDSFLPLDIILGLWHKVRNKLHPFFFIETGLQLLGRLTRFKRYSQINKQRKISEAKIYLMEKLEVGREYIKNYLFKEN